MIIPDTGRRFAHIPYPVTERADFMTASGKISDPDGIGKTSRMKKTMSEMLYTVFSLINNSRYDIIIQL